MSQIFDMGTIRRTTPIGAHHINRMYVKVTHFRFRVAASPRSSPASCLPLDDAARGAWDALARTQQNTGGDASGTDR
jgi:hypothetical protein